MQYTTPSTRKVYRCFRSGFEVTFGQSAANSSSEITRSGSARVTAAVMHFVVIRCRSPSLRRRIAPSSQYPSVIKTGSPNSRGGSSLRSHFRSCSTSIKGRMIAITAATTASIPSETGMKWKFGCHSHAARVAYSTACASSRLS